MQLELWYPVRPYKVNKPWGVPDPVYEAFGFKRHNGEDAALATGQTIRAPFDCEVTKVAFQPTGAGHYVALLSKNEFDAWKHTNDGKKAFVEITFMHCQRTLVVPGQKLKIGDPVALGDNTGFSTGPHTHIAPKRVIKMTGYYSEFDTNDALGTFDPAPYWNKFYAENAQTVKDILNQQVTSAKLLSEALKQLVGKLLHK
ncbi:M23 family metallopeptidase [bacterium]|nr:M23 family metallopeptidase [bacterium]MCI0679758.1 M23 family metallopeptidase [bacterium]